MSDCPFCTHDPVAEQRLGLLHRAWQTIQWLFPATLLVLIPKCPMCIAAYVALFTGLGISIPTARWIQILLQLACLLSLAYVALRFLMRRFKAYRSIPA